MNKKGYNPLLVATIVGNEKIARLLLQLGADPSIPAGKQTLNQTLAPGGAEGGRGGGGGGIRKDAKNKKYNCNNAIQIGCSINSLNILYYSLRSLSFSPLT